MGIYTPSKKISPSKFLWGKNDVRTAIQQFYTQPQKKILATPLLFVRLVVISRSPIFMKLGTVVHRYISKTMRSIERSRSKFKVKTAVLKLFMVQPWFEISSNLVTR